MMRTRESLMKLAEALDPDTWDTPEAVLQGVSNADGLFEKLRAALAPSKRKPKSAKAALHSSRE